MLVCWIVGLPGISCEHQSALRPPGPQPGPPRKALAAQVLKEGQLHLALCKHPLAVRMRRRCCPIWGCGRRDSGRVSRATPGYVVSFQWNMRSELCQLLVFLGRKAVWGGRGSTAFDPYLYHKLMTCLFHEYWIITSYYYIYIHKCMCVCIFTHVFFIITYIISLDTFAQFCSPHLPVFASGTWCFAVSSTPWKVPMTPWRIRWIGACLPVVKHGNVEIGP